MGGKADVREIARRFLDLWEAEVRVLAREPGTASQLQRWLSFWMAGTATQAGDGDDGDAKQRPNGPASFAAPSRGSDHDMDELIRRIGELEARLAAMAQYEFDGDRNVTAGIGRAGEPE